MIEAARELPPNFERLQELLDQGYITNEELNGE